MSDKLCFYYDLMSQPSRTIYIFLSVNRIEFEKMQLQIGLGENRRPEFKRINPTQQLPAISHGDFNLSESIAIVRYICREFDVADHWYPRDSRARARVDEYLEFQHLGLRLHCAHYFRVKFLDPVLRQLPPNPDKEASLKKNMMRACDTFERVWLADRPFICGDKITIADIFAASELEQPIVAGYDPREGRPSLAAWMERVRRATNPHYDTAHAALRRLMFNHVDRHPAIKSHN